MISFLKDLLPYLPITICVLVAGALAIYGREGWGWFLFVAVLLGGAL